MSSNESKLNETEDKSSQFSYRFCDDMSSVLLSFVSFEDKILFECVSHQFQRLLFNKQYVLEVKTRVIKTQNKLNQFLIKNEAKGSVVKQIDLIAFERVLKKFKFINKIIIKSYFCIECENSVKV